MCLCHWARKTELTQLKLEAASLEAVTQCIIWHQQFNPIETCFVCAWHVSPYQIQLQVFHWRCHCMDQMHTKRNHWRQQNQAQPIWCAWPGHCTNIYDATPVGASRVSSCRYDQCPGHNPWISSSQVQNPSVVCNEPSCLGGFGSAQGI